MASKHRTKTKLTSTPGTGAMAGVGRGHGGGAAAPGPDAPRVAVVVSRYNATVTDRLLAGALGELSRAGVPERHVEVFDAAGSFEVPQIVGAALSSGRFECAVALGCIIKGETKHDEFLGASVTDRLLEISLATGCAVGLGVLTVNSNAQAVARAGGKLGNKGAEAASAALLTHAEMVRAMGQRTLGMTAAEAVAADGRAARPDKLARKGGRR
ncbi:MAG: 6,7-dimethyl-8-ribityllumazine synthase [Planctomycetaceae bacterium]|nr:6,7-dimethyl-8-ribityllumazine synthase [Phycisphaerales bacterium]MCE2653691.1 6,7-dimethyl-8-ribityllumazine synthase [Planctomycetaceae bacterium]